MSNLLNIVYIVIRVVKVIKQIVCCLQFAVMGSIFLIIILIYYRISQVPDILYEADERSYCWLP